MTASQQITAEVTSWEGVEAGPGRRGEFAFKVGRREIGHLHGDHTAHFSFPKDVWGFNGQNGKPKDWPLRFSWAQWSVTLKDLKPGAYEFRVRTVDLNGIAQPEPRPYQKSGQNTIQYQPIMVMG